MPRLCPAEGNNIQPVVHEPASRRRAPRLEPEVKVSSSESRPGACSSQQERVGGPPRNRVPYIGFLPQVECGQWRVGSWSSRGIVRPSWHRNSRSLVDYGLTNKVIVGPPRANSVSQLSPGLFLPLCCKPQFQKEASRCIFPIYPCMWCWLQPVTRK